MGEGARGRTTDGARERGKEEEERECRGRVMEGWQKAKPESLVGIQGLVHTALGGHTTKTMRGK